MRGSEKPTETRLAALCGVLCSSMVLVLATSTRAEAYVDPDSWALIWQAVLAACFGAMLYLRRVIRAARSLLNLKPRPKQVDEGGQREG